jgi:hypothetical protein
MLVLGEKEERAAERTRQVKGRVWSRVRGSRGLGGRSVCECEG